MTGTPSTVSATSPTTAGRATIDQRRDELLDLQTSILLDVARVYYEVLRSEQSSACSSSLKVQEERLRDTTGRQQAGMARPLDVASQAQVSATRVQLLQPQTDVKNGRSTLAFLIDAPIYTVQLPDGFDPVTDLPAMQEILRNALAAQRDLAAAIDLVTGGTPANVSVAFRAVLSIDRPERQLLLRP